MGVITAVFQQFGNTPVSKEVVKIACSGSASSNANNRSAAHGIPSGVAPYFKGILQRTLRMPSRLMWKCSIWDPEVRSVKGGRFPLLPINVLQVEVANDHQWILAVLQLGQVSTFVQLFVQLRQMVAGNSMLINMIQEHASRQQLYKSNCLPITFYFVSLGPIFGDFLGRSRVEMFIL